MSKLISVIVTCYNRANTISRTINSVLSQSYKNIEIIIVNDGSTDQSQNVLDSYSGLFENIKIIRQKNSGQNAAIKKGIESASGSLLSFLDAGDVWKPDFLEKMCCSLAPEDGFVYCWLENGPRSYLGKMSTYYDVITQGFLSSMITLLVRNGDWVNHVDAFFPDAYSICQDDKFCFELSKNFKFSLVAEPLAYAIPNENSMTQNKCKVVRGWVQLYYDYKEDILNVRGDNGLNNQRINIVENMLEAGMLLSLCSYINSERFNPFSKHKLRSLIRKFIIGLKYRFLTF